MARRPAPRVSVREARENANKWDRYYAMSAGMEPQNQQVIAPKREIVNRSEPGELEAAVMREVADVIILAPSVLIAWRQNTGSLPNANGAPIWFYKFVKWTDEMTLVDYLCILKSGRLAAIECKRVNWKYTGTPREVKQDAFIQAVRAGGGRGGFVTGAEQALEILKG